MRKPIFTGSAVAIVTPFTKDNIDFNKLEELIEFQIKNNTDALVICGTTGEASTLSDEEHLAAIKFAVDITKKRIPVIAGTGSNDTRYAIELSQKAQELGADAILSVTPYYNKTTQKGLFAHFQAIAQSITIPIILYNVPGRTGLNINPETVKLLSEIINIVAIKECNLAQVGDIVNLCSKDFVVYSGDDNMILPTLSIGGKGVISVMANIIPQDTHDIASKYLSGDLDGAMNLQLKVLNLIKTLFIEVSPIPIKAAMNLMKMNVGTCRLPLVEMSESNLLLLKNELKSYKLI